MVALRIQELTKVFPGNIQALKGINLEVEEGEFFGLLGPNGAGKSTTINILSGLTNKSSGSVSAFEADLIRNESKFKSYLGIVPQEFNFNIFEKVIQIVLNQAGYYGIPYREAKIRAEKYLQQLQLWDKRNQPARNLSGGMKRRLMIARALMHEPRILILDEPTAGVDIELRRSLWKFLAELNRQGITIILTTHYLEEAESLCKRIAIIDKGQIIANQPTKDLLMKLDTETFILDLKDPIEKIPESSNFQFIQTEPKVLEVNLSRSQDLNTLFECLGQNKIRVLSMRNKANRLEELFLDLVETK